jgi:hypothetical protein
MNIETAYSIQTSDSAALANSQARYCSPKEAVQSEKKLKTCKLTVQITVTLNT